MQNASRSRSAVAAGGPAQQAEPLAAQPLGERRRPPAPGRVGERPLGQHDRAEPVDPRGPRRPRRTRRPPGRSAAAAAPASRAVASSMAAASRIRARGCARRAVRGGDGQPRRARPARSRAPARRRCRRPSGTCARARPTPGHPLRVGQPHHQPGGEVVRCRPSPSRGPAAGRRAPARRAGAARQPADLGAPAAVAAGRRRAQPPPGGRQVVACRSGRRPSSSATTSRGPVGADQRRAVEQGAGQPGVRADAGDAPGRGR